MNKCYALHAFVCAWFILLAFNLNAQNKPIFSIPFTLIDNRPFIDVKIKGHTLHCILDCGADFGLDLQTANRLGLKLEHPGTMGNGAGANRAKIWTTQVPQTQIGTVQIPKTTYLVTDVSEVKNKLHLPYLDGFVGYSFMKNYAVQFDYPKRVINFYSSYTAPSPIPFTLYQDGVPQIKAKIDGIEAPVIFDTGDRTAFTLLPHFAAKAGIAKHYKLTDTMITGFGLGGPVYARRFILKSLQMGNIIVAQIPSRLPTMKSGFFADTYIAGSIGGGVLKQYKFTIDYKGKKIYLE
jgi:predicted aspartyl protease